MLYEIKRYFEENRIPKFRVKQLENAIFKEMKSSFEEVTTFPKRLREDLFERFNFDCLLEVKREESSDSYKFVFKTLDGNFVESVLMFHEDGRRTLCVSSQIFCPLNCKFCATGANKFRRNLSYEEIIWQVLLVNRFLKDKGESVTNVVFMGMGEPFLNYENVISSIKMLNDEKYFGIGARHIVVSTVGIVDKIYEFADIGLQVRLAISLHASNDELRDYLMPINKKYNISKLLDATSYFSDKTNKRVTFEYVLIKDVNDSSKNARELGGLLKDKLAFVNLLIYNPHEFIEFERPDKKRVNEFKEILESFGVECSIRKSLGDDISGACGQLSAREGE